MTPESATVAEQEYLETMFWIDEAGLPMTGANIARAMQLSPPTVSEMVGRLINDGYVAREPNKSLTFTDSGRDHASYIVRRHRMIERFLTDVLQIPWDEVHEEAERIEHAMRRCSRSGCGRRSATPPPASRPPDPRGHPRARLASGRRQGRRRRRRPALRERGRGTAPLPDGRRDAPRPRGQAQRQRRHRGHHHLRRRRSRRQPQRSPRRSRSAPTRRRPPRRDPPSSSSSAATATAAEFRDPPGVGSPSFGLARFARS